MDNLEMTTQEFADKLGVAKEVAYLLLQYMEKTEIIKRCGLRKPAGGKGQGQVIYSIPKSAGERMKIDINVALAP